MTRRDERGQATVEFALIIPLVVVVLLAVVQVALVAYSQLAVTHIARETARSVAVDRSVDVGLLAQQLAAPGDESLGIEVIFESAPVGEREFVVVTVWYETPVICSLFLPFATQLEVSNSIKMLIED